MSSHELIGAYPEQAAERDRWILARRGARNLLDSTKPFGFLIEEERAESGQLVSVATIFLTNRECPWRCLMCDLWKYALTETVPVGAIPAQIDFALVELSKQCSARFQPASSGDIPAERFNRQQEGSSELRRAIPIWKTTMKGDPPSPLTPLPSDGRGERPEEGETSATGSPVPSFGDRLPSMMPAPRRIKLYNSGSFFDPRAIPPEDYPAIADRVRKFERTIVECHPALVGESALTFRDLLGGPRSGESKPSSAVNMNLASGTALTPACSPLSLALTPDPSPIGWARGVPRRGGGVAPARLPSPSPAEPCSAKTGPDGQGTKLELAMGLETAHPEVLEKLNKRMKLEQFRGAAEFLRKNEIALRVFILIKPPFLTESEALHWAERSVGFAFDCGANTVSLIPTRPGNGALEALAGRGEFSPPKLSTLEAALDYGIGSGRGQVCADLWDLEKFSVCPACFEQRRARLHQMNLEQIVLPPVNCERCRGGSL